jgi:hypothetical protein
VTGRRASRWIGATVRAVAACVLVMCATAGTAAAASVSMSGPAQGQLGGSVYVRVSGQADPAGNDLTIFDQATSDACQATAFDEMNMGGNQSTDDIILQGGSFARTLMLGLGDAGSTPGAHRLCGYLLARGSDNGFSYGDTAAATSVAVDEEPLDFFLRYIPQDEQLMISVINDERARHHLRRLTASARMQRIAQHRFDEHQCPYDTLPGCDVIFDLHRAHICVRHAREYEFPGGGDLSPDGARATALEILSFRDFRHDALLRYWREIGLAIGPQGGGLIVDFLGAC